MQLVEVFIAWGVVCDWWRGQLSKDAWMRILCDLSQVIRDLRCPFHMRDELIPMFRAMGWLKREVRNKGLLRSALDRGMWH